jgi:hypothetical protein
MFEKRRPAATHRYCSVGNPVGAASPRGHQ